MIRDYSVKSETGLLISSGVFPNTSFKSFCSVESSKDDKTERHDYYDPIVTKLAHEIRSSVRSYSEQQSQAGRAKIHLVGIMDPLKKQGTFDEDLDVQIQTNIMNNIDPVTICLIGLVAIAIKIIDPNLILSV